MLADLSFYFGLSVLAFAAYELLRLFFLLRQLQQAEQENAAQASMKKARQVARQKPADAHPASLTEGVQAAA